MSAGSAPAHRFPAATTWLLVCALVGGAAADEGEPAPADTTATIRGVSAGPHAFQVVEDLVLRDEPRAKDLHVRITYPREAGRHPLIVYSHGAYGSKDAYAPLVEHWASHGYICIQPTHEDSLRLGARSGEDVFRTWRSRPADVRFLLDSMDEIAERLPALGARLDRERIGVGGHSFGAHTAQLVGGVTTRARGGEPESHRDPRVRAVLLISPQGRGDLLTETSFQGLVVPALIVTGSRDRGRGGQSPTWRRDPFDLSPAGSKWLVWIDGADHGFGGITGRTRPGRRRNADHVAWVKAATLSFWNATLREDEDDAAYLASDRLPRATDGALRIERR
ncbi:MAG: alpha/beta hydrolase family protein [Planctomycetota bacterium]|jgi:predicted dienelactone hydrolase